MAEERTQRRLAAILAADVVGFSSLMEMDEVGTMAALKARRRDVLDPLVAKHAGRVFKTTGDGVLVEFASAVNAVQCAVDLQQAMAAANAGQPEDRHIVLRIGINLGDVMVEGRDLYGDGINIAARLEALAEPGGILVSGTAQDHMGTKIKIGFEDIGAQTLKNIAQPVRAFRVTDMPAVVAAAKVIADKPSIALLPFVNMSGDPAQEFFADGITENIITGLSRFRDLTVIASNSTFAYKGKAVKIQDVSRELGVRYILEGSVQKSSDRVRITAQLIDGATGRHLWAERYDRGIDDVFVVQDEVTERIIGSLATAYGGRLLKAWQERPEATGTRNLQALDYFVRGMDFLNRFTMDSNLRARELFGKATQLDPRFAKAYAKIAWTYLIEMSEGWNDDAPTSLARALEFAKQAIERDDAEPWGRYALAGYYLYCRQQDRAIAEYQRALELNPNDADVLTDYATCLSYAGRTVDSLEAARKAMRLNPHYPEWYTMQLGQISFDARRYQDAIAAFESLRTIATMFSRLYLAASHAALGHVGEARKAIERVLESDPQATMSKWTSMEVAPYTHPDSLKHFRDNLLKAGLPE